MRKAVLRGAVRVTRSAHGVMKKVGLAFCLLIYTVLVVSGFPIALYSFSSGGYFAGARVLGILGVVLAVSAILVRVDALDQQSLIPGELSDASESGGRVEASSHRERIYREYVVEDRFLHLIYALSAAGVIFMAISFIPLL